MYVCVCVCGGGGGAGGLCNNFIDTSTQKVAGSASRQTVSYSNCPKEGGEEG